MEKKREKGIEETKISYHRGIWTAGRNGSGFDTGRLFIVFKEKNIRHSLLF
jgi:hypothetical protein